MGKYDTFHKPPPPEQFDWDATTDFAVENEAIRQVQTYYPFLDKTDRKLYEAKIQVYIAGIRNGLKRGTVRIENSKVFFWHPGKGTFTEYDSDYNDYMLGFFKAYTKKFYKASH